ncbi:MAG: carboxypeptidase-like regulatory domain-containing protein [Candidatus Symbiothrix sp.]|jgi:hypothetical protein|nr:carboxypeptidase-like regulatory domain-containing protein [Candidatus Symbiothrix sp.]
MKKILFLILISLSCFFSCFELDLFKNDAVNSITVTGKVVDVNTVPIIGCEIRVNEDEVFMFTPLVIDRTSTNEQGEFIIEFSPSQDKNFVSYSFDIQKFGYLDKNISIDKRNPKQHFDIVLETAQGR